MRKQFIFDPQKETATAYLTRMSPILGALRNDGASVANQQLVSSIGSEEQKEIENKKKIPSKYYSLKRITECKYSKIEEETLISALIYIDHLCNETHIMLTEYNVHRILFTACLLSIQYNEDEIFNMEYYAQICGVKTKELHRLESFFCDSLHFQLYISEEEFLKYQQYLYNENKVDSKDTILMEYEGDVSMLLYHTS